MKCTLKFEHGYFEPITSGVKFQYFGAHLTCRSRMSMRVGAFDRYTLPLWWKNMELVCRPFNFFLQGTKVEKSLSFRDIKWRNSEISDIKNHEKIFLENSLKMVWHDRNHFRMCFSYFFHLF